MQPQPTPSTARHSQLANPSELHQVGLVALAQAKRRGKVAGEHVDLLDVGDQGLIDGLLVSSTSARNRLLL